MDVFVDVLCPVCGLKVMEIATGLARGLCRKCKHRVTAGRDTTGSLHVLAVDKPLRRDIVSAVT